MEDCNTLSQKIEKLKRDRKAYIEFSAGCFIGLIGVGVAIEHKYDPFLLFLIFVLFVSLIASFVIGVKKALEQDQYELELKELQTISSQEGI